MLLPQHLAAPPTIAQAKRPPIAAWVAPLAITWIGASRVAVVPSPIWPSRFPPQHWSAPLWSAAQLEVLRLEIAVTAASESCTGLVRFTPDPSPTWPEALRPQQATRPLWPSSQEKP